MTPERSVAFGIKQNSTAPLILCRSRQYIEIKFQICYASSRLIERLNLHKAVICDKFDQIIEILTMECTSDDYGLMQCAKLWNYLPDTNGPNSFKHSEIEFK